MIKESVIFYSPLLFAAPVLGAACCFLFFGFWAQPFAFGFWVWPFVFVFCACFLGAAFVSVLLFYGLLWPSFTPFCNLCFRRLCFRSLFSFFQPFVCGLFLQPLFTASFGAFVFDFWAAFYAVVFSSFRPFFGVCFRPSSFFRPFVRGLVLWPLFSFFQLFSQPLFVASFWGLCFRFFGGFLRRCCFFSFLPVFGFFQPFLAFVCSFLWSFLYPFFWLCSLFSSFFRLWVYH